ncbi:MAG TPA: acetylornithine/succinylornithine family transaminase [Treponemataceae bacterium]|nr:acetylornithine/succinylornithine family transaminase [Treponemataceae bacterium]
MAGKIINNLGSLPIVFTSGAGSILTDIEGKKYIDFVAGIGVNCLGHAHPSLVKAVCDQASKQIHISNYYNSDTGIACASSLLERTGMDQVFFGNSGAEANEAAIKIARKFGTMSDAENGKKIGTRHVIVTLEKSFHGRTITTLAATGQEKFHSPSFAPYPSGFKHIAAHDWSSLDTVFDETVCAVMLECVQGEGGVNLIETDWAQAVCVAAKKAGALVIADEVQTGVGRTGKFLASEDLGINPDVLTLAKGIAGGVPMGACLAKGKAAKVLVSGDHQSTFGGNPLACSASIAVLTELAKPGFLSKVAEKGDYMRSKVAAWKLPCITHIRGKGLMIGIDITISASEVQLACLKFKSQEEGLGLCISTAGLQTLRFLPPLNISMEEIDTGLDILYSVLQEY